MPTEFVGHNRALLSVTGATVECVELLLLLTSRFFCILRKVGTLGCSAFPCTLLHAV